MRTQRSKLVGNPKRNKDESMIILVGPKKSLCSMAKLLTLNKYSSVYTLEEQKDSTNFKNYVLLVTNKPDCKEFKKMPMHWYKYYHDPKINSLPKLNTYYIPKEYWKVFHKLELTYTYYWIPEIEKFNYNNDFPGIICSGVTKDPYGYPIAYLSQYRVNKNSTDSKLKYLQFVGSTPFDLETMIAEIKSGKLIPLTDSQYNWRRKKWMKKLTKAFEKL